MTDTVKVLLVEDNPGDVELIREQWQYSNILCDLQVATDGIEAMAYLRNEGKYAEASKPDLILLDLNLPRKNGWEVLAEIKQDPDLCRIPVAILTSSEREEDVTRAYSMHASTYVCKPVDLVGYGKIMSAIDGFWLSVVRYSMK
jgi:CheY-like chemotaxis protein